MVLLLYGEEGSYIDALKNENRYTYSDYAKWNDKIRYELIDGIAYMMSPSPSRIHQGILGRLYVQLWQFLKGKTCEVYISPFDVRLNVNDNDDNVVQPDLIVVCDKSKLDDNSCAGAPDMVIEILSPSSARFDKFVKFQKYQAYGVREYWIVDPASKTVQACVLENGKYIISAYADTDAAPVHILKGCAIELSEVFE